MTDLVSYLCVFLEINRAGNVLSSTAETSCIHWPLHPPSHSDIHWLLRVDQAIQSLKCSAL